MSSVSFYLCCTIVFKFTWLLLILSSSLSPDINLPDFSSQALYQVKDSEYEVALSFLSIVSFICYFTGSCLSYEILSFYYLIEPR